MVLRVESAKDYVRLGIRLDWHMMHESEDMVQELLAKQPADPLEYMCEFLQDRLMQGGPSSDTVRA